MRTSCASATTWIVGENPGGHDHAHPHDSRYTSCPRPASHLFAPTPACVGQSLSGCAQRSGLVRTAGRERTPPRSLRITPPARFAYFYQGERGRPPWAVPSISRRAHIEHASLVWQHDTAARAYRYGTRRCAAHVGSRPARGLTSRRSRPSGPGRGSTRPRDSLLRGEERKAPSGLFHRGPTRSRSRRPRLGRTLSTVAPAGPQNRDHTPGSYDPRYALLDPRAATRTADAHVSRVAQRLYAPS
jgi:hypothetical protein